jgi:DNA-binding transcriptional regulator YiaG
MTTPIDDAVRVRVIRAILGMSSRAFAARIGVSAGTLTAWERSRATPQVLNRNELAKLCQEHHIAFAPSGFPLPASDVLIFKEPHND